eukprot:2110212-Pyramimonas_sp.AAC.1
MRDAIEDLDLQVMRLRFCHFVLKYDRFSQLPSGSYLQVATACARIPTKLRRCTWNTAGEPAHVPERTLDWHGQGAQEAEWRNKTLAIMTARLLGQMDLHKTQIITSAVHRSIHARVDKGVRTTFSLRRVALSGA